MRKNLQTKASILIPLFLSILIFSAFLRPLGIVSTAHAETQSTQSKEELQAELKDIEKQIEDQQKQLEQTQDNSETLRQKLEQLTAEQKKIHLELQANRLQVTQIGNSISETQNTIAGTESKITEQKNEIATVLRLLDESNKTFIEIILSADSFSEFFNDIETTKQLSTQLTLKLNEMESLKETLEKKRGDLETQREETKDLVSIQQLQQQEVDKKSGEQQRLLTDTKGKESTYQKLISENQLKAQDIRNRLYETQDGNQQITFGDAFNLAQFASGKTGVRAAFILAILTQESNLGKNVGTCNRAGDPESKSWRTVMKPDRDQQPFLTITKELGKNPDTTPISCPMRDSSGNQVGWGGAMGPAQFIPSTWVGYRDKVSAITGKPANPWDIRDAMLAASIKLKANGGIGSRDAEWRAAMIYFSGSTNPRFSFYGDRVMALTETYQRDIDELNK